MTAAARILAALFFFLVVLLAIAHSSAYDEYDDFCKEKCSTLQQCSEVFGEDNYVELRVRTTNSSALEGPGEFLGDIISRQKFHTQFILDISSALSISTCRLYITTVSPERSGTAWDSNSVFVTFRLVPAEIPDFFPIIRNLTAQIQHPSSNIYQQDKRVSSAIDPSYGLVASKWDFSIKISIDISITGQDGGIEKNHDRLGWCLVSEDNSMTPYCEFERFFRNDLASALSIPPEMIDVLFVKPEGQGSVVVTFRFLPVGQQNVAWINGRVATLVKQMSNYDSPLYRGNVTHRLDPAWGVSNEYRVQRTDSKYLVRSVRESNSSPESAYERCKSTHRCSRGWNSYNESTSHSSSTMQSFAGGQHKDIPLFADFEDWRQGTRGWKWSCSNGSDAVDGSFTQCKSSGGQRQVDSTLAPPGAHWSPFDFDALGPHVPSFNTTSNNGLVLNNVSLHSQLEQQAAWIEQIQEYIDWLRTEMNVSSIDTKTRARVDVQIQMTRTMTEHVNILSQEEAKYASLASSQCNSGTASECSLLFNTSSLEMIGTINATGVIATTPDGTEVAVWAFDSIDLDEIVKVTLTGQRAMALVSRSSVRIDTALQAPPGSLGAFPGGYSIARRRTDRLESVCGEDVDSTSLVGDKCTGDQAITTFRSGAFQGAIISNNVNGPGSGSVRVYLKTIETTAPIVDRVQTITVDADQGQTLAGGFKLHFNGYSTPFIPHNAKAKDVKDAIEGSMNPTSLEAMDNIDRASNQLRQGVGEVTVQREAIGTSGGNVWTVTYISAVGTQGNLTATNLLGGEGANVAIQTQSKGNTIGGHFSLSFLGDTTRPIPHDVSSEDLQLILLNDISSLENTSVLRSDPTNKCDAGLCANGPSRSGGYVWTLSLTTQVGNVSPFSPTSQEFDVEGEVAEMTAINNLTGCAEETKSCPEVIVTDGHGKSHIEAMKNIAVSQPFSLAYGGSGASHGGRGGEGFTSNLAGESYGDKYVANLYAGSGGALGVTQPFEITMVGGPRARGGSGGGAIEIVAANDISLGPQAVLSCDGQDGFTSFMTGGGGGSGGTVLLSAGGAIHHEGVISVAGGNGGRAIDPNGHQDGGGGGGGRVAMYSESIVMGPESETNERGGSCPVGGVDNSSAIARKRLCDGEDGTIHLDSRLNHEMHVDYSKGAAGTSSSLRLRGSVPHRGSVFRPYDRAMATQGGPENDFGGSKRPGRISFYVQTAAGDQASQEETTSKDWGAMVELRSRPWSEVANGPESSSTAFIGISIGREMKHGANIRALPYDDSHLYNMSSFLPQTVVDRWYKIDIRLNWILHTYDISLDDTIVVKESFLCS